MEDLFIQGTESLPNVSLKQNGEVKISGRALPEDASKLFAPIFDWIKDFTSKEIQIEINLDYFNTSVSKRLLDFFKVIDENTGTYARGGVDNGYFLAAKVNGQWQIVADG